MRRPGGVAGKGRGRVLAGGDHLRGVRAAARELLIVGKTAAAVHKLSLPGTTRARRWCCRPARGVGVVQVRAGGGGPRGCRLQIGIRARHALRPRRPACRPLHPALWHGLQRVWSSELLWGAAQAARARPPSRQLRVRHAGAPAVAARPDQRPARGFAATSLSGGCVRTGGRSAAIQLLPCAHLAAAAAPAGVWGGEARSSRHPMWRLLTPAGPCSGTPTHQARANLHFHRQAWPHGAGARLRCWCCCWALPLPRAPPLARATLTTSIWMRFAPSMIAPMAWTRTGWCPRTPRPWSSLPTVRSLLACYREGGGAGWAEGGGGS